MKCLIQPFSHACLFWGDSIMDQWLLVTFCEWCQRNNDQTISKRSSYVHYIVTVSSLCVHLMFTIISITFQLTSIFPHVLWGIQDCTKEVLKAAAELKVPEADGHLMDTLKIEAYTMPLLKYVGILGYVHDFHDFPWDLDRITMLSTIGQAGKTLWKPHGCPLGTWSTNGGFSTSVLVYRRGTHNIYSPGAVIQKT